MWERRAADRITERFVLRLDSDLKNDRFGLVKNHSRIGVLFATPSRFRVGQRLALSRVESDGPPAEIGVGHIVRIVKPARASRVARYLVAVALDG